MRKTLIIGILVSISLLIAGCGSKVTGSAVQDNSEYDNFAKCLTEKGVTMYGTEWCPHCQNQKKMFGKSFMYVDYIDCDLNRDECLKAGIKGYPTWVIDGNQYPGEQPFYRLAQLTGCKLGE